MVSNVPFSGNKTIYDQKNAVLTHMVLKTTKHAYL